MGANTFSDCPNYCSLSHCWGKVPILTLKKSTLDAFQSIIDWSALPKTFQEAMHLTVNWCIIQDCKVVWEVEASKMSSYCCNAVYSIAALGAANGSQGLCSIINPLLFRPCKIKRREGQNLWISHSQGFWSGRSRRKNELQPCRRAVKQNWLYQKGLDSSRTCSVRSPFLEFSG